MTALPVLPAHQLSRLKPEHRWLVESLWGSDAVGIIGGEPKSCKSFLALDMAVSVTSGRPCLDKFMPRRTGRVLLFAAEDALHLVRERLDGICAHHQVDLANLDLLVITAPIVRLDIASDREDLADTVQQLKPVLLILDPFVRLHRVDENVSAAVVPLLAFLRELQRKHGCAVAVVHHARKGAANIRSGQALRGSSEFHAWSDSSLFIRRKGDTLRMSVEHRAYPSIPMVPLRIHEEPSSLALVACDEPQEEAVDKRPPSERDRILESLRGMDRPTHTMELRKRCRMRTATLCSLLGDLVEEGIVVKTAEGWKLRKLVKTIESTTDDGQAPLPLTTSP